MERASETEWIPNEELLTMLMDMGISKIAAEHALFYTGNNSAEAAASYVFDNFENDEVPSLPVTPSVKTKHNKSDAKVDDTGLEKKEAGDIEDSDDESTEGQPNSLLKYKMVFVVNTALNMGVGKIAAQVAHASLGLYRTLVEYHTMDEAIDSWTYEGEKKIVLKGENHLHLQELQRQAELNNIHSYLVHDAGRTQIPPNSVTVLALFGEEAMVNNVSGSLQLL
ncbi:hypothetical protein ILUMI_05523 [Ignelater luminosus]|uniref:peptidyl-tRNA hydrolase n=1 Tax=Ignelater luminosus TaxID=2038154 RepID=A0A8K0GDH2_IGNLU|nr:hypothetical protein ILUMI_05523 [Ignelater luminosus]